ncbi:Ribose-phosphate pyrophosphokinase [Bienertia sinuspersici]
MDIESTLKLDPSSPNYLGLGDQPGNYFGIKSRHKFVFIDSTITKPMDSNKILDWETVNTMLVSWMFRSMDTKVSASIPYFDEAKTLSDYLEKRFCVANGLRLQQLIASIIDCKQSHYMTLQIVILVFFFMILLDLNLFMGALIDREEEKFHQFLIDVDPDKYGPVKSNLISQSPSPDLNRAYEMLVQE